jgi:hypothetical protein
MAVFEQVIDENGNLRKLDHALESTLNHEVHVPRSSTQELYARLAALPTLESMAMPVKGAPEDCPAAPAGEECAGPRVEPTLDCPEEGCDMVVSEEGATKPAPGLRQVA